MITPLDIENKFFPKKLNGYNPDAVDDFLDEIIIDMQKLLTENKALKNEIESLKADIADKDALVNAEDEAKKIMNDISESAEKRADAIIKNAYIEAETIKSDAKNNVAILTEEERKMKQNISMFKVRYRQLLEEELNSMDTKISGLFGELNLESEVKDVKEEIKTVEKETIVKEKPKMTKDTMVVDSRDFEEMLMEDYSNIGDSVKFKDNDKDKTIII